MEGAEDETKYVIGVDGNTKTIMHCPIVKVI